MSLFRTREIWTAGEIGGPNEQFNTSSLCVGKLLPSDGQNADSDQLIVGSLSGYLRIYDISSSAEDVKTSIPFRPEHLLLENELEGPILQVEAGDFISGAPQKHLAVLLPKNLTIYAVKGVNSGVVEHGTQYSLQKIFDHKMVRSAYNFAFGPFGGAKNRDFICVQSLDGCVTVFEQENVAFSRFLPSSLLPGPLIYVPMSDSFVTVSASWELQSYKYQNLAVASGSETKEEAANQTSGKRVQPDWAIQLGEGCLSLSVVEMSPAQPSILVLGERNLFCFTEGGTLRFVKRLDYNPTSLLAYSSTSEGYVQFLVGSHSKTAMFYSDSTLRWAAQLSTVPLAILRAQIGPSLGGMLVVLDGTGNLSCSYLGTDPALFGLPQTDSRYIDYPQRQKELRSLQSIIKNSSKPLELGAGETLEDLTLTTLIPNGLDEISIAYDTDLGDESAPSMTVRVVLKAKVPLENVQLFISVPPPLAAHQTAFSFSTLAGSNEVPVTFFARSRGVSSGLFAEFKVTYLVIPGGNKVVRSRVDLPLALLCKPCAPTQSAAHKFVLETNKSPVAMTDIFPEFALSGMEGLGKGIGFQQFGTSTIVSILASKTAQKYRVQSDSFESIWLFASELCTRLRNFYTSGDLRIWYPGTLPLAEYFRLIDHHFELGKKIQQLDEALAEKCSQLRAVQKQLLTKFKDTTPTPLAHLDGLFEMTYRQVVKISSSMGDLIQESESVGSALNSSTKLLLLLIRLQTTLSNHLYQKVKSALQFQSQVAPEMLWEERADVAVTHLLQMISKGQSQVQGVNAQDIPKLADTQRLKKHISLLCDKLSKAPTIEAAPTPPTSSIREDRNIKPLQGRLETIMEDTNTTDVTDTTLGEAAVPTGSTFVEVESGVLSTGTEERSRETDEFTHQYDDSQGPNSFNTRNPESGADPPKSQEPRPIPHSQFSSDMGDPIGKEVSDPPIDGRSDVPDLDELSPKNEQERGTQRILNGF